VVAETGGGDLAAVSGHAAAVLRAAGLDDHRVAGVTRVRGGSKKGVYRLSRTDGSSVILYVWSGAEDYWPAAPGEDATGVFGHASGIGLFERSAARLSAAGVRVPRVYLADRSRAVYPADIALVEDVRGGTLEELLAAGPRAAEPVMERLGGMLMSMWRQRSEHIGKAGADHADPGGQHGTRCEQIVLGRALRQLDLAAERVPRIAAARSRLARLLRTMADAIEPRTEYALIHGELGPDHVLVNERREPVIIDIEGAMYFDAEWEHVFLRLRFGQAYRWLRADGLDERRLRLYSLALDLSLIEGPLRLLDGDFPDRDEMLAIAGHAVDRALGATG
jgi:hypothetical protein